MCESREKEDQDVEGFETVAGEEEAGPMTESSRVPKDEIGACVI